MENLQPLVKPPAWKSQARKRLKELRGRPEYDEEKAWEIVEALASGLDLKTACRLPGVTAQWVVNLWRAEVPEFDEACVRAAEAYAEQLAYETVPIADGLAIGHSERSTADRALSVNTRLSVIKFLNRKKYDPAVKVTVSHGLVDADAASDAELARVALGGRAGTALIDHETGGTIDEPDTVG